MVLPPFLGPTFSYAWRVKFSTLATAELYRFPVLSFPETFLSVKIYFADHTFFIYFEHSLLPHTTI